MSDLPAAGNIVQAYSTDIQCLVLFHPEEGVPQAILQPFTEDDNLLLVSLDHTAITSKHPDDPQSNTCTILFEQQIDQDNPVRDDLINNSCLVWSDSQGKNAIHSRQVLLHLLHAMQQHGRTLVASGDLYSSQRTAATLFFQSNPCMEPYSSSSSEDDDDNEDGNEVEGNEENTNNNTMTEICCIGFHNTDKIRLYQFSSEEATELSKEVISKKWKFGVLKDNVEKFPGIPEFKLAESPWWTFETSNEHHLEARRLVLGILNYMWHRGGYHTVVPVDCYVKGYLGVQGDMDNLVFYRTIRFDEQSQTRIPINKNEPTEFICLCLERTHKLRMVGSSADGTTHQAIRQAVADSWSQGVKESSIYEDSYQIKVNGNPWGHRTTPEAIAAAQLVCAIIEALFEQGWIWHCAMDMTRSLVDKSTFFFRRVSKPLTNIRIGCIQPKGLSKINLVRFPPSFLITIMEELQTNKNTRESGDDSDDSWFGAGISELTIHENGMSGTIEFDTNIHATTEDNIKNQVVRNSKIYRKLITRLLEYQHPQTKLLGFGDIWTCETKDDELYIRDTDACFFSFPYKEQDWNMTSTHSLV